MTPRHRNATLARRATLRGATRRNKALNNKWLFVTALLAAANGSAATFVPDREMFFQRCAVLANYEMDQAQTAAVPHGRTKLSPSMKEGINRLFDVWAKHEDDDGRRLAFILATARRESMGTFLPIREAPKCGTDEGCRERAIGELLARRAARDRKPVKANYALPHANGSRYYGRGYIQLTHHDGYARASRQVDRDLVKNPDLALDPAVAGEILVRGMLQGWFGSKKPLSAYISGDQADWINARNNVNPGSPNKPVTAAYAKDFWTCLQK